MSGMSDEPKDYYLFEKGKVPSPETFVRAIGENRLDALTSTGLDSKYDVYLAYHPDSAFASMVSKNRLRVTSESPEKPEFYLVEHVSFNGSKNILAVSGNYNAASEILSSNLGSYCLDEAQEEKDPAFLKPTEEMEFDPRKDWPSEMLPGREGDLPLSLELKLLEKIEFIEPEMPEFNYSKSGAPEGHYIILLGDNIISGKNGECFVTPEQARNYANAKDLPLDRCAIAELFPLDLSYWKKDEVIGYILRHNSDDGPVNLRFLLSSEDPKKAAHEFLEPGMDPEIMQVVIKRENENKGLFKKLADSIDELLGQQN